MNCELCLFKNPKASVTGIIIRNNAVLLLRRNQEPYKGAWDFPGGYMQKGEYPEASLNREIKEELDIDIQGSTFINSIPGMAQWKDASFPVLNMFFLVEGNTDLIILNDENKEYCWMPIKDLNPEEIAFDSNREFAKWFVSRFAFNLEEVKELVRQLDPNAEVKEQNLYKALLNGDFVYVKDEDTGKLIGMGWSFTRQTLLRKQVVIEDMIVNETWRGKGIGKEILSQLIDNARKDGAEVMELTTNPKRIAAHALYEKAGFVIHPTDHMLLRL